MGRTAAGVRGIRVGKGHEVIALLTLGGGSILTATENGFGKRSRLDEFPVQGRGGQGVIGIRTSERNGRMVGALQVEPDHEVILITSAGTLVRTAVSEISEMGRSAQGVRLIRLDSGDSLVGMQRVETLDEEPYDGDDGDDGDNGNSLST
jgi:DNA gyrase subunit A